MAEPGKSGIGDAFATLLGEGDAAKADSRYRQLFRALSRYFEWRGCDEDPEDLAQTVFERILRKLREGGEVWGEAGLTGLAYGIARNVLRESRKRPRTESIDSVEENGSELATAQSAEVRARIRQYLGLLDPAERRELLDYVDGKPGRPGESAEARRIRVFRIRRKLRSLDGKETRPPRNGNPASGM